ncbi:hypothetical protein [Gemmata sp.]|uniref:hypothetical protein n=1 Tax=Gemmata sp. TaxID=1914242 RepID=UPI003F726804
MIRRLVAIYMTFVLVAGPSLCCCTTGYAATATQSAPGPAAPSPDRTPPCCCEHAPAEQAATVSCHLASDRDESQPAPKPGKHHCPCKDKDGKRTPDATSPAASAAQDAARLLTADLLYTVASAAEPLVGFDPDSEGGPSPPGQRLTSWRLLNAPHMLRC